MTDETKKASGRPYAEEHGLTLLSEARAAFENSNLIEDVVAAERRVRDALRLAYSAFNWLEDTEYEDRAHDLLHEAGRSTRERFPAGCRLMWTGSRYEHRCPVVLAHKRIGLSPGMIVGKRMCSICGDDPADCEHRRNQVYAVRGGPGSTGSCPVCFQQQCSHSADEVFQATPATIIAEIIEIREVSFVPRPRQPDARLMGIPVDEDELRGALDPDFRYGEDVVACSQCLHPCQGFDRLPSDPRLTETENARTLPS